MRAQSNRFSVHQFTSTDDVPFSPESYSLFKFGAVRPAQVFGYQLAERFFAVHAEWLLAGQVVVFASPYSYVPNASSVMAEFFVDRLNALLIKASGLHLEVSRIHRKVTYFSDYGFLSKSQRASLIAGDSFYINKEFVKGKRLLFLDDIRITGTHEDKLVEMLTRRRLTNSHKFLYYAELTDPTTGADIEAQLNFAAIKSATGVTRLMVESADKYRLIVRPIKYLLGLEETLFAEQISVVSEPMRQRFYHACIGEGYHQVPRYQSNINHLQNLLHGNYITTTDTLEHCPA